MGRLSSCISWCLWLDVKACDGKNMQVFAQMLNMQVEVKHTEVFGSGYVLDVSGKKSIAASSVTASKHKSFSKEGRRRMQLLTKLL